MNRLNMFFISKKIILKNNDECFAYVMHFSRMIKLNNNNNDNHLQREISFDVLNKAFLKK